MDTPLLGTDSDDEEKSLCIRKKTRRKPKRKLFFPLLCFFPKYSSDEDMSFSSAEITYFDNSANRYNLANFMDTNPDAEVSECLTLYFLANFAIVQGNSKEGEQYVRKGQQIAMSSHKPDLYTLLMASPLARVFYMENNLDALCSHLQNCFQIIEIYGQRGVPASILGWLYYMRARSKPNDRSAAIADYKLAISAFNSSETNDKDFGMGHALCRLIICRLGCGEKADSIDDPLLIPPPKVFQKVKRHFEDLDKIAVTDQNIVIRILYLMAGSDFEFRKRNIKGALEITKAARNLVEGTKCKEFLEVVDERERNYTRKYNEISAHNHGKDCTSQHYPPIQATFVEPASVHIGDVYITENYTCQRTPSSATMAGVEQLATCNEQDVTQFYEIPTAEDVAQQDSTTLVGNLLNVLKMESVPSSTQCSGTSQSLGSVDPSEQEVTTSGPSPNQISSSIGKTPMTLDHNVRKETKLHKS